MTRSTISRTSSLSAAPMRPLTITATCRLSIRSRAWAATSLATSSLLSSHRSNSPRGMLTTTASSAARNVAVRRPPATIVTSPASSPATMTPTSTAPSGVSVDAISRPCRR